MTSAEAFVLCRVLWGRSAKQARVARQMLEHDLKVGRLGRPLSAAELVEQQHQIRYCQQQEKLLSDTRCVVAINGLCTSLQTILASQPGVDLASLLFVTTGMASPFSGIGTARKYMEEFRRLAEEILGETPSFPMGILDSRPEPRPTATVGWIRPKSA